jgi:DNA-binding phage protein
MVQKRLAKNVRKSVPDTAPYDSAEFLNSRKAVQFYIREAMESGDAQLISHAAKVVARAESRSGSARNKKFSV